MKSIIVAALVLSLHSGPAISQEGSDGGAKPPRPAMSLNAGDQYKRVHQLALRYILLDRDEEAASFLNDYLSEHPDDAETHFILGLLHARRNRVDRAVELLREAIRLGLPGERVIVGPRELLGNISQTGFYRALLEKHAATPLHGPLLGNVTDQSATIWVRTARESSVRVLLYRREAADVPPLSAEGSSSAELDYTVALGISGLSPDTEYDYAVQIGSAESHRSDAQHFRTFPQTGSAAQFTLAFGGGAGYVPPHERMWETILAERPLALLLLGDNVYIDDPESLAMQNYTYYRRQSRPEWRGLTAQTATFTIWDDHDFSVNDSWGGSLVDLPDWKRHKSWPIFTRNWANPGYGGGEQQPGCWYTFSIGDVDFIMLDCRYYRTDPRSAEPSMLGPVQLAWLKQQLSASSGTFKVLCSSVPWDFRTKGDSRDTWNGFRSEREEIFSYLQKHGIEGVLLMSADRHRSDAWRIERPDGYDLYEFNSSRLTNQHVHPTRDQAIFSYNAKQSFGRIRFDTTADDPFVTYDVINIDGEMVHSLTVRRGELQFSR